jgi:hypothetical protein
MVLPPLYLEAVKLTWTWPLRGVTSCALTDVGGLGTPAVTGLDCPEVADPAAFVADTVKV